MKIVRLANGESRVRTELVERKRREDILRKYRLFNPEADAKTKGETRNGNNNKSKSRRSKSPSSEDEYEDDHEDENDDGGYGSDFGKNSFSLDLLD